MFINGPMFQTESVSMNGGKSFKLNSVTGLPCSLRNPKAQMTIGEGSQSSNMTTKKRFENDCQIDITYEMDDNRVLKIDGIAFRSA